MHHRESKDSKFKQLDVVDICLPSRKRLERVLSLALTPLLVYALLY